MKMRKTIYSIALLLCCSALSAQNLNPVVEVTNAYESGSANIEKPVLGIEVPDSVMKFKLDFDYSSLETPYSGSYEFRPYLVELRPQAPLPTQNRFYLRAGAGYSLHPEVELVVTPVLKDNFTLNIFADHNSYFGSYKIIAPQGGRICPNGEKWAGADMGNRIGADGVYSYGSGEMNFSMSYDHAYNSLPALNRGFYGFSVGAGVKNLQRDPAVYYDANLQIRTGTHVQRWAAGGRERFADTRFLLDGTIGFPIRDSRAFLDAAVLMDAMSVGSVTCLRATPRYVFDWEDVHFDLGVRIEGTFRSRAELLPSKGGVIFPAVRIAWRLMDDMLVLQGSATGGNRYALPYELMDESRFLALPLLQDKWDVSVERVRAMAGVRGSLSDIFGYDLQLGYANWKNARFASFNAGGGDVPYTLGYADLNMLFAELWLKLKLDSWKFNAHAKYSHVKVNVVDVLGPAPFTFDASALYDWGGRIQAGLSVQMASERRMRTSEGTPLVLPSWWDLGVYASYAWTRNLGFWIKGGNLLCQNIQRVPGISEKGLFFTAGIRLNF